MITGQTWLNWVRTRLFDARRAKRRIGSARRMGVVQTHVAMIERLEHRVLLSATMIDNIETSNLPCASDNAATPVSAPLTLPTAYSCDLTGATIAACQTVDTLNLSNIANIAQNFVDNVRSLIDSHICDGGSSNIANTSPVGDGLCNLLNALENAGLKFTPGSCTDAVINPCSQVTTGPTSTAPGQSIVHQAPSSIASHSPADANTLPPGFSWDSLHFDDNDGTGECNVDLGAKVAEFWQNVIAERDQLRTEWKTFLETSLHDAFQNTVIDDLFAKIDHWL